jgi:hypothetical protein
MFVSAKTRAAFEKGGRCCLVYETCALAHACVSFVVFCRVCFVFVVVSLSFIYIIYYFVLFCCSFRSVKKNKKNRTSKNGIYMCAEMKVEHARRVARSAVAVAVTWMFCIDALHAPRWSTASHLSPPQPFSAQGSRTAALSPCRTLALAIAQNKSDAACCAASPSAAASPRRHLVIMTFKSFFCCRPMKRRSCSACPRLHTVPQYSRGVLAERISRQRPSERLILLHRRAEASKRWQQPLWESRPDAWWLGLAPTRKQLCPGTLRHLPEHLAAPSGCPQTRTASCGPATPVDRGN